jgi:hypothetical protein
VDKFDRTYRLHSILRGGRTPIPRIELMEKLECSRPVERRLCWRALRKALQREQSWTSLTQAVIRKEKTPAKAAPCG